MKPIKLATIFLLALSVLLCAATVIIAVGGEDDSPARFTVYADTEEYQCDSVEVDGVYVTLDGCVEYGRVELVGGQDWTTLTVEVNQ